jgi:hypothetical protein
VIVAILQIIRLKITIIIYAVNQSVLAFLAKRCPGAQHGIIHADKNLTNSKQDCYVGFF